MDRRISTALRVAAAAVAVAVLLVLVPAEAADASVGDLLVRLATALNLPATSPAAAAEALRAAGYEIPALDLDKVLTEGDVVAVARALGIRVSSSSPDAAFDASKIEILVESLVLPELDPSSADPLGLSDDNGADPATKGRGRKKGLDKTPSEP